MPRPKKCRRVCHVPQNIGLLPIHAENTPCLTMSVDEYETIRLIDKQGLSQEECAAFMQVARTTVQQIYTSARQKLAAALVDGLSLQVSGGDYVQCSGNGSACSCTTCYKKRPQKGEHVMRIAVTYQNGQIFQHFGHTAQFKIYDVENGTVTACEVVDTQGSGHGALAGMLSALGVNALICGGIGGGAQSALAAAGITLYAGVSGEADMAVGALLAGKLNYDPNAKCDHHDHHHGEDHTCHSGDHHCGGHCHE